MKSHEDIPQSSVKVEEGGEELPVSSFEDVTADITNEHLAEYANTSEMQVEKVATEIIPEGEKRIEATAQGMNVSPEMLSETKQEFGLDAKLQEVQHEADQIVAETKSEIASVIENKSEQIEPAKEKTSEEAMIEYTTSNEIVAKRLSDVENKLNSLHNGEGDHDFDETEIDALIAGLVELQQEKIAVSANYPGDWTGLLYKRLMDPASKEKFIARRTEAMIHMEDDPSKVGRREMPKAHYQAEIDAYDTNIERVFSMTEVGPSEFFGKRSINLGNMGNEGFGAVFTDAEHKGSPLTSRQKNIIEAHEKGHCLRDFVSPFDRREIQNTIDRDAIADLNDQRKVNGLERIAPTYVSDPMEIAERMAQFKNYFGMGARDKFEKRHLDYIREHYVTDAGLDNGVSDLLYVVTPETESAFLDVINKYPI